MKTRLKNAGGVFALTLFIITAAVTFVILFTPMYRFLAESYDLAANVGLTLDELMANYYDMLRYLNLPWVNELVMADFPVSASGAFHFYEVKRLFFINYGILIVSGLLSFFYLRTIYRERSFYGPLRPLQYAMIIPIVLLGLLALNFDRMFVVFHEILFNNDAWLFNPATDPIINVLPQDFFMLCFIVVFVVMEIVLLSFYIGFKRKTIKR